MTTHHDRSVLACWPTYLAIGQPVVANGSYAAHTVSPEVLPVGTVDVDGRTPRQRSNWQTED
jgi:hypothetical protein